MEDQCVDLDVLRKRWATLRACFALAGYQLAHLVQGGYRVSRWDLMVDLDDLRSLLEFAERAGIDLRREAPP